MIKIVIDICLTMIYEDSFTYFNYSICTFDQTWFYKIFYFSEFIYIKVLASVGGPTIYCLNERIIQCISSHEYTVFILSLHIWYRTYNGLRPLQDMAVMVTHISQQSDGRGRKQNRFKVGGKVAPLVL